MKHWIAIMLGALAAMTLLAAGVSSASTITPALPDQDAQRRLVHQSMQDFTHSITAADMRHFHSTISRRWQAETTVDGLQQAFQALIDAGVDWTELDRLDPVLVETAHIDDNGVLLIAAEYPTEPNRLRLELAFVPEDRQWKLLGFHLRMIVPETTSDAADDGRGTTTD